MEKKTNIEIYSINPKSHSIEPAEQSTRESVPVSGEVSHNSNQNQNLSIPLANPKIADSDSKKNNKEIFTSKSKARKTNFYFEGTEVKKSVKIFTLWGRILSKLNETQYPAQVARQLNITKQKLNYHLRNMEEENLITQEIRSNITSYKLTDAGRQFIARMSQSKNSSLCVRNPRESDKNNIRSHSLRVKLNILTDNTGADFTKELEYARINKRNWDAQTFILTRPIGMTIEKSNKSKTRLEISPDRYILEDGKSYANRIYHLFSIFTKSLCLNIHNRVTHVSRKYHTHYTCVYSFFNQWNFLENKLSITCRQF